MKAPTKFFKQLPTILAKLEQGKISAWTAEKSLLLLLFDDRPPICPEHFDELSDTENKAFREAWKEQQERPPKELQPDDLVTFHEFQGKLFTVITMSSQGWSIIRYDHESGGSLIVRVNTNDLEPAQKPIQEI